MYDAHLSPPSGLPANERMADHTHGTVEDHYATLGVERDATTQDIKRAFRRIARECHPDVAGADRDAAERFKRARAAYEALVDPVERSRYDRRRQPRQNPFEGAWWGGFGGGDPTQPGAGRGGTGMGNDLDLEDIFNDFGAFSDLGFGGARGGGTPGPRVPPDPLGGAEAGRDPGRVREESPTGKGRPRKGEDVHVEVEVPAQTAADGGSVTVEYRRLRRTDDGGGLESCDDLHELRIPAGTQQGETLRVPRLGHYGEAFGLPGDLVCTVRVAQPRGARSSATAGGEAARPAGSATGGRQDPLPLPISVTEALLGGRVEVATPSGPMRLVIPPCTSSGTVLRLRPRARGDASEAPPTYLCVQVVMPSSLDEPSRALILEFARLNPYDPRA